MSSTGMHILFVSGETIPSRTAESMFVMKMCQAMAKLDYRVTLTVPKVVGQLDEHSDSLLHHYGIDQAFSILALPCNAVPTKPGLHLFSWRAVRRARSLDADLVYSKLAPAAVFAAHLGIPTIYGLHQVELGVTTKPYLRLLRRGAGFQHFVILTQGLRSDLLKTYPSVFRGAKTVLAHNGVDLERFEGLPDSQNARKQLGLKVKTRIVAGYAGGFVPGKGVELVFELARRCPQLTFLLVGGEPEDVSAYRRLAQEDGLHNMILTGFVANAELPIYLAACDLLLLPNQRAAEKSFGSEYDYGHWTSPLKLFEYMASGRMIIASDLPVLSEVLHHGTALLCPPEDLDAWQQALLQSAVDEHQRQALSSNARLEVEGYTWTNRVIRCLDTLS